MITQKDETRHFLKEDIKILTFITTILEAWPDSSFESWTNSRKEIGSKSSWENPERNGLHEAVDGVESKQKVISFMSINVYTE